MMAGAPAVLLDYEMTLKWSPHAKGGRVEKSVPESPIIEACRLLLQE